MSSSQSGAGSGNLPPPPPPAATTKRIRSRGDGDGVDACGSDGDGDNDNDTKRRRKIASSTATDTETGTETATANKKMPPTDSGTDAATETQDRNSLSVAIKTSTICNYPSGKDDSDGDGAGTSTAHAMGTNVDTRAFQPLTSEHVAEMVLKRLIDSEEEHFVADADEKSQIVEYLNKYQGDFIAFMQQQQFPLDAWVNGQAKTYAELKQKGDLIYKTSLARLVDISNMNAEDAKKSISLEIDLAPGASDFSNLTNKREISEIGTQGFSLATIPKDMLPEGSKSELLTRFVKNKKKTATYFNEAGVQSFVGLALQDAVDYVNLIFEIYAGDRETKKIPKFQAHLECGMFSNRPDHYVLTLAGSNYHYIFLTETKKEHSNLFESKSVAAQLFDYLMLQKFLCGRPSIGVLTCFNQSKIVWDPEINFTTESSSSRMSEASMKTTVAKIFEKLQQTTKTENDGDSGTQNQVDGKQHTNDKATSTPPDSKPAQKTLKTDTPPLLLVEDAEGSTESPTTTEDIERKVVYSNEKYGPSKLFAVFCNVLFELLDKGLEKIKISSATVEKGQTLLVLKEKGEHEWRTARQTIQSKGTWTRVDSVTTETATKNAEMETTEFHCTAMIGVGSTSRCWRAMVKDIVHDYDCVVKYWTYVFDTNENQWIEPEAIEEESKKTCSAEVDHYKIIYKDLFFRNGQTCVGVKKLNGTFCVVLPFFEPISPNEDWSREKLETLLGKIEGVLKERFYKDSCSYQFDEFDQVWRHVGKWTDSDGKEHIVLFDLAYLKPVIDASENEHESYVKKHVEKLRQKAEGLMETK